MNIQNEDFIKSVPIWKNKIDIDKISGGITNKNFLVTDGEKKYFVRLGNDIPEHLVSRSNELIASQAAAEKKIGPNIIFSNKGILILDYIESHTLSEDDVRKSVVSIIPLIKKVHEEIPKILYGQTFFFWVFHIIKNYANFLKNQNSHYGKLLPDLLKQSEILEKQSSPYEIVFSHNDLLSANFLNDGSRLWLIDWEYAGFNTPLFDLGSLAANNNFSEKEELFLLENYYEKKISEELLKRYYSIKCSALLRETMWSMVSELTSKIEFDYKDYTTKYFNKFNESFKKLNLKK